MIIVDPITEEFRANKRQAQRNRRTLLEIAMDSKKSVTKQPSEVNEDSKENEGSSLLSVKIKETSLENLSNSSQGDQDDIDKGATNHFILETTDDDNFNQ